MPKLEIVVGAQFGSEAKGHVVQRLTQRAQERGAVAVVRVAGPNAGHTGHDADGTPWALRQVPVAAVTPGTAILGIAAGSEIDPPVLLDEFDRLRAAGLMKNKMLWVSEEATLINDDHKMAEGTGRDNLVHAVGSTGKGIGAARAERAMRKARRLKDDEGLLHELATRGISIADAKYNAATLVNTLIIEGTQGYGLGLHAGFYPQCTSSNCRAVDFMAMTGVHPWQFEETEVWAVARMYPIRVAGNSGPLNDETTWAELGLPEERTTVTKKVRRVGMPDWELVRRAVVANGGAPTVRLAVTMVDQMFPWLANKSMADTETFFDERYPEVIDYFQRIERVTYAKIGLVTTGPDQATFMDKVDA
jgi:adenylosuccinate synthase